MFLRTFLRRMPIVVVALLAMSCGRTDERPPTFTYVYEAVLGPNCATIGCHNSFTQTYGFQFNSKEGMYAILTGRACTDEELEGVGEAHRNYVFPGDPDRSSLIALLYGDDVPRRMPPDRGLSNTDIRLVEEWILEGAQCD